MWKVALLALQLLRCTSAFTVHSHPSIRHATSLTLPRISPLAMSQWADEDDVKDEVSAAKDATTSSSPAAVSTENKAKTKKVTSFNDAEDTIRKEDNDELMDEIDEFDSNPDYTQDNLARVKAAIEERTKTLGIEKSVASAQAIQEAEERERARIASLRNDPDMLDLTKVTSVDPARISAPESTSAIDDFFADEDEGLEEYEKAEADPTGELELFEQFKYELQQAEWPTMFEAFKSVLFIIGVILLSAYGVVGFDSFIQSKYTEFGVLPRPDEVSTGIEDMILPDGWTNGMSEDDYMNFREEVAKKSSELSETVKTSLNELLPDL